MNKNSNQELSSKPTSKKEQITIVLAPEIIEKLEDVRFYAQKQLPREDRRKLNKSRLYEMILQNFLSDYEKANHENSLARIIVEWNNTHN